MSSFASAVLPYFAPVLSPDWTIWPNVKYGETSEEIMDLYLLNTGVHPVVMFIHGGGWQGGDKVAYQGRARKYALAGFHVVAINYRLAKLGSSNTYWPAQLQDCQAAVRWLRQNAAQFRIDPYRVGVGGDSAGGHLALEIACNYNSVPGDRSYIAGNQSPWCQCVLDMFGPTALTEPNLAAQIGPTGIFGGKTLEQAPDLYKAASPLYHLPPRMPPTIIFHGTSDTTVPYWHSKALDVALTSMGQPHKFITFDGGHEFAKLTTFQQISIEMEGLNYMVAVLKP